MCACMYIVTNIDFPMCVYTHANDIVMYVCMCVHLHKLLYGCVYQQRYTHTCLTGSVGVVPPPPRREYMETCPSNEAVLMMAGLRGHQWHSKIHCEVAGSSYTT